MSNHWKTLTFVVVVATSMAASCFAAGDFMTKATGDETREQSWAREQKVNAKQDATVIIQQKAQVRAEQRQARLASSNWYGMSSSRPSGVTTPFMSRYGSAWEMPGGRPYSWYPANSRPEYFFFWR